MLFKMWGSDFHPQMVIRTLFFLSFSELLCKIFIERQKKGGGINLGGVKINYRG